MPFRHRPARRGDQPLSGAGQGFNLPALQGAKTMIALVWRYEVLEEARAAFEATYAPTGAWAQLFARAGGYRGTELFRAEDGSYLTLDIWRARAASNSGVAAVTGLRSRTSVNMPFTASRASRTTSISSESTRRSPLRRMSNTFSAM